MRVCIPYPNYWPYVRRGVERCIHDFATYLSGRGHDVHVITSTPGAPRSEVQDGVRVTYLRQLNHPLVYRYRTLWRLDAFAFAAARVIVRERPDVTYLWTHSGLSFMPLLKRIWHLPYVAHMSVYWPLGKAAAWFPEMGHADQLMVLNHGAAPLIAAEFPRVPVRVLPPPVDTAAFRPVAARQTSTPLVLFPADLADPRKGGRLLLRAWDRVHRACPKARLVLCGSLGVAGWLQDQNGESLLSRLDEVRSPSARDAIELRGPGDAAALPALYSSASVTVLPSVNEMFGMVLTESLACGTPVVASRHAGPGEIVGDPAVGVAVDLETMADLVSWSRADALADAILAAIELARDPGTRGRCHEWAQQWSLERIGAEAETILLDVAAGKPRRMGRLKEAMP